MKILILGARTYPPMIGGIEQHVYEVSKRLVKKGHSVEVIVSAESEKYGFFKINGVIVHKVPTVKSRLFSKNVLALKSISLIKKINPDLIYANDPTHGFLCARFIKKPFVYTSHGVGFNRKDWAVYIRALLKLYETTAVSKAKTVIAVDKDTYVFWKKRKKNVKLIPNGIDVNKYKTNCKKPKIMDTSKIKILSVSRLIPTKGVSVLIDAFNNLDAEIMKKSILIIVGDGPDKVELQEKCKNNKNICFVGYVCDTNPFFKYSDMFVLPSFFEGMPISLLEAMGSKNACISTDIADIKERFKNVLILVEAGDVKQLRDALTKVINDETLRRDLSEQAFERVKNEYDWDSIAIQIETVFKKAKKGL
ncbi:MAG: glycosyltransferase family 4 protein [DPANN group archaeon]|nr:glycosyltransferase family 4 protein [DPANN group archaeon]